MTALYLIDKTFSLIGNAATKAVYQLYNADIDKDSGKHPRQNQQDNHTRITEFTLDNSRYFYTESTTPATIEHIEIGIKSCSEGK